MKPTRTLSIRVPEELARRLDDISEKSGISVAVLTRQAVEEYCGKVASTKKIEVNLPTLNFSNGGPILNAGSGKIRIKNFKTKK